MFDLVNGLFEIVGGLTQVLNIRQLVKDKQVKGVSWPVTGFFMTWGLWNLLFYSHLDQWFSFFGGMLLVVTNATWLALLLYYTRKKKYDRTNGSNFVVYNGGFNTDPLSDVMWVESNIPYTYKGTGCTCSGRPTI